jgi:hypothetical protein
MGVILGCADDAKKDYSFTVRDAFFVRGSINTCDGPALAMEITVLAWPPVAPSSGVV